MLLAKSLKKGDTIGIIVPSKPLIEENKFELDNFIKYMNKQEINIKLSDNFFAKDKYSVGAGTPQERADDLNNMFADKSINAIWCLQGGAPANQILPLINFDLVKNNPKIFLGKSDIDVLLLVLNKFTGLIGFHTCDAKIGSNKELDFEYTQKYFKKRLFEKSKIIEADSEWFCINKGKAQGKIMGCNPVSILKLAGTKYFPDFTNSILFLEFFRSQPSEVIWQLTQFKQLGIFNKIKGIVIGNNHQFDNKNFKAEEVIADLLAEYNFPILKINEFGHYQPHTFLPIGAKVELDATNKTINLIEDFLE
ncbi:MAG: LD-carboxypeptidase [Nanoarchaeota archaeon]|nr:LD-carboxypeptidase [Nanoarchaeota archaeon]MCA9495528.1 LD-carboxypeptidase [Nanoarchaeota archaeon]